MLKVAAITRYFPSSGEPWQGRSAYQTLRVLAREAKVKVFFPNAAYPKLLKPKSRLYYKLDTSFAPPDVDVSYYDYPALPLITRPINGWSAARRLLPEVRSFAPDVIFSVFLYPDGYAALRVGQKLSVPVVAMAIGSDINGIPDRVSARYTRQVLHTVDYLVTVSEDLRRKAVAMGAPVGKTRTILNGCDLSVFHVASQTEARKRLNIDVDAQTVVYIGRMDLKKGLRELVEAAVAVHPNCPKLHVYMIGAGPDRQVIDDAVHVAGASGYIHILPACAPDEIADWMVASDVVTLPSYMEGCPNAVLEALACGRPVVATNVGGIPEILSDRSGILIPPRDPAKLAEALNSVLDKQWDSDAISREGSRSWGTVSAELLDVLETVSSPQRMAVRAR